MSQLPELDKLVEEQEIFRTNMRWRKSDNFFKKIIIFQLGLVLLSFLFLVFITITNYGIVSLIFSILLLPLFFPLFKEFLKDDWQGKDMYKRYKRM